jgi:hypothetical protein
MNSGLSYRTTRRQKLLARFWLTLLLSATIVQSVSAQRFPVAALEEMARSFRNRSEPPEEPNSQPRRPTRPKEWPEGTKEWGRIQEGQPLGLVGLELGEQFLKQESLKVQQGRESSATFQRRRDLVRDRIYMRNDREISWDQQLSATLNESDSIYGGYFAVENSTRRAEKIFSEQHPTPGRQRIFVTDEGGKGGLRYYLEQNGKVISKSDDDPAEFSFLDNLYLKDTPIDFYAAPSVFSDQFFREFAFNEKNTVHFIDENQHSWKLVKLPTVDESGIFVEIRPSLLLKVLPELQPKDLLWLQENRFERAKLKLVPLFDATADEEVISDIERLTPDPIRISARKEGGENFQTALEQELLRHKKRIVCLIGHVEEDNFVILDAASQPIARVNIAAIDNFAEKHGIILLNLGCNTARTPGVGAGFGVKIRVKDLESQLRRALAADTFFDFFERIGAPDTPLIFTKLSIEPLKSGARRVEAKAHPMPPRESEQPHAGSHPAEKTGTARNSPAGRTKTTSRSTGSAADPITFVSLVIPGKHRHQTTTAHPTPTPTTEDEESGDESNGISSQASPVWPLSSEQSALLAITLIMGAVLVWIRFRAIGQ